MGQDSSMLNSHFFAKQMTAELYQILYWKSFLFQANQQTKKDITKFISLIK